MVFEIAEINGTLYVLFTCRVVVEWVKGTLEIRMEGRTESTISHSKKHGTHEKVKSQLFDGKYFL